MRAQGWKRALWGAAMLAIGGCDDQEVSLQIVQMEIDGQCLLQSAQAGGNTNALGEGTVDLAISTSYAVYPRVTNNMLDVTTVNGFQPPDGRIDTHDVVLKEAIITYETEDQALPINIANPFRQSLSGTIPVNGTAVVGLTVLPPKTLEELRANEPYLFFPPNGDVQAVRTSVQMLMRIKLRGETLDGTEVETSEFVFPVRICNGCRMVYPPDAIDISAPVVPNCRRAPGEDGILLATEREACQVPGTDNNFVDCRECPGLAVDLTSRQLCEPAVSPVQ